MKESWQKMAIEYLVFCVPVLFAIWILFYFIYHIRNTKKYTSFVLNEISSRIKEVEVLELELPLKLKQILEVYNRMLINRTIHLFDLERNLGIDMFSLEKKLDRLLKKKRYSPAA